ncbi:MAG: 50S ribosomal protein L3 [Candidatus Aureabacteria bacterium]|nr:50S ribosomal protein L3 [Candidatus Auribacterota bacterium]
MKLGLIGRKIGMTQLFNENGNHVPLTVIQAGPCVVIQKKTTKSDRYNAIQLGFEEKKEKLTSKPLTGHFSKAGLKPKKILMEMRLNDQDIEKYNVGDSITIEKLEGCKFVDVTGTTKGRGFTGVAKRHGFQTPKKSHGTHDAFRHGGSLGSRFPQRVVPGRKMAGHYGNERVTIQNLQVHSIRKDDHLILVEGAVPGPNNSIVIIKPALKKAVQA